MIPERVRLATLERLRARVDHLARLIEDSAPAAVIARGCTLVGQLAGWIAPYETAAATADDYQRAARSAAGVCADLDCDRDAGLEAATPMAAMHGLDDYCSEHADKILADRAAAVAITNQEPDDEPS